MTSFSSIMRRIFEGSEKTEEKKEELWKDHDVESLQKIAKKSAEKIIGDMTDIFVKNKVPVWQGTKMIDSIFFSIIIGHFLTVAKDDETLRQLFDSSLTTFQETFELAIKRINEIKENPK